MTSERLLSCDFVSLVSTPSQARGSGGTSHPVILLIQEPSSVSPRRASTPTCPPTTPPDRRLTHAPQPQSKMPLLRYNALPRARPAAPNRTPTQPVPNHCKTQRRGRQDEPRVAGHDAVHGLWCHRVRARLLRLLQALEAERPQVRSRPMAPRRSLRPPRGKLDGVLGGEREGDSGAGGFGASLASGSRAGSPAGPTSTLRQAQLNGVVRAAWSCKCASLRRSACG